MNTTKLLAGAVAVLGLLMIAILVWPSKPAPEPAPITEPEVAEEPAPASTVKVIGQSVEGRDIEAHTFGQGATKLLFVGGVHGGYEWNSVYLAEQFIDRFNESPDLIPEDLEVTIIPNLNPDALFALTGSTDSPDPATMPTDPALLASARFNANDVDLNRNFDCKWQPESTWRGQSVSAGEEAFSEPEAAALRDYVTEFDPEAVIFWHSQANTVYASECEAGVLPETLEIMEAYADAADYNTQAAFDAYSITGDAEGWLASLGIPAITVELETRTDIDWNRNIAGVDALFDYYSTKMAR